MKKRNSQLDAEPVPQFSWLDTFKTFWYFLDGDRKKYIIFTIILTVTLLYNFIPPLFIGKIVDFFTNYHSGDDLTPFYNLCFFLAGGGVVAALLRILTKGVIARITFNARYRVKVWGFQRLLDYSLAWHQKENSGNKLQRILTGADGIRSFSRSLSNNILVLVITLVWNIVAASLVNPIFIVLFCIYFTVMIIIEIFFDRKISRINELFNKNTETSTGVLVESSHNILAIKALGAQKTVADKVQSTEEQSRQFANHKISVSNYKWICFQSWNSIIFAVYLIMLGFSVINNTITVGSIFIYLYYFFNLRDRTTDFTEIMNDLVDLKSDVARMMPIFLERHTLKTGNASFPKEWEMIELQNAAFNYSEETKTLKNINFSVQRYEKVGIAGHSGSGKSTLAKIFLGLYQLQEGTFTVGKSDYYNISHDEVTDNITVVLQESELFNITLKENITMMRAVNESLLRQAIDISQLGELIEKLPNGVNTMIGEKGYALSGGERQRVGIARAICKNAPILLLDEATSALDSITEEKIMTMLFGEFGKNKTMLIIAHRVSTLKNTDKLVVMDSGEIIEQGTFNSLVEDKNSHFYQLSQNQNI